MCKRYVYIMRDIRNILEQLEDNGNSVLNYHQDHSLCQTVGAKKDQNAKMRLD